MSSEQDRRMERLLDAAGRAVQPTHPGWQTLPERLSRLPQAGRGRHWWWLVPAPFGVAAAIALWLLLAPRGTDSGQLQAQGPIEVQRQDVDLTILSVAETE